MATPVSQLTTPLTGTEFGVDFNPAADALRVISDQSQNLRHSLVTYTTTVDTPLSYGPGVPATDVTMAGYTNNDLDTGTGTTLFDVAADLNQVAIQAPANNGTLNPTSTLGVDVGVRGDVDVYTARRADGRAVSNDMYGAFRTGPLSFSLYTVEPLTGDATLVGDFGASARVVDISFPIDAG